MGTGTVKADTPKKDDQGPITIVIAEDHGVVAEAFRVMLSFQADMEVVEVVNSGDALVESVLRHRPTVALVDVQLEESDGLAAVKELHDHGVETEMLVVTSSTDPQVVTRAVAADVAGYLPKNVNGEELVPAIRAVAAGKGVLHPDVTRPFLRRVGPMAMNAGIEPLSKREQEVLEELATGKSTREIAEALGLGDETVKSHLSRIYQKLKAKERVQAVVIAMRHGLVH